MLLTDNVYMVPKVIAVALEDGVTSSYVSIADCFVRGNLVCFIVVGIHSIKMICCSAAFKKED